MCVFLSVERKMRRAEGAFGFFFFFFFRIIHAIFGCSSCVFLTRGGVLEEGWETYFFFGLGVGFVGVSKEVE